MQAQPVAGLIQHTPSAPLMRLNGTPVLRPSGSTASHESPDAVLASNPANVQAWFQKGMLFKQQKNAPQALHCFNQALHLAPEHEPTLIECGNLLFELEQFEFSLAHHEFALQLNPACVAALHSKSLILSRLGRYEEALLSADQLVGYAPTLAPALLCRGSILHVLGRHHEALASYQQIPLADQQNALFYLNLANLYLDMLDIDMASDCYRQALTLEPHNPTLHWNLALFQLLTGDYAQGWAMYESGKHAPHLPRGRRAVCVQPMWTGEQSLQGKRILLYAEQGLGDTIQFIRYAKLVATLGAQVIIEVQASLIPLLRSLGPDYLLIAAGTAYQDYDYHCSLMSLPYVFKTELGNLPQHTPYLFAAPDKVSRLQMTSQNRLRVGLVWSGSTTHQKDRYRSIPLAQLAPLLALDASFHSLQKEVRDTDQAALSGLPQLTQHQAELEDFSDTAALIARMDLIISVDTSVAHLAGAMHKPVWILLPDPPDFRWLLAREDSPWYPSARLFRAHDHDWTSVITDVKQALAEVIAEKA